MTGASSGVYDGIMNLFWKPSLFSPNDYASLCMSEHQETAHLVTGREATQGTSVAEGQIS